MLTARARRICACVQIKMLTLLRVWIGLVAAMAFVNALNCFLDQTYPKTKIYDLQPSEATNLLSRMFGVWTLLAFVIRTAFVISPRNQSIFAVTFASFVLVFLHFALEVFVYHTASPSLATIPPLFVSGISMLGMTFVWPMLTSTKNSTKKIH